MPFELPDNLHPDCGPVAWLLGRWGGRGHGDYPTIDGFQYGQELVFTHDGRPFFHYFARAWIVDEHGDKVEGDLLYAYDMAAMGQPLQPHLWARLVRQ